MSLKSTQIGFRGAIRMLPKIISDNAKFSTYFIGFILGLVCELIKHISCFLFSISVKVLRFISAAIFGFFGYVILAYIPILMIIFICSLFSNCEKRDSSYPYNKYYYGSGEYYDQNNDSGLRESSASLGGSQYKSNYQSISPKKSLYQAKLSSDYNNQNYFDSSDYVSNYYNNSSGLKQSSAYVEGGQSGSMRNNTTQPIPHKRNNFEFSTESGSVFSTTDLDPSIDNVVDSNQCLNCKCKNLPGPIGPAGPIGSIGPVGPVGSMGPQGIPGKDGVLPIWELCLSLAGVLILLYFSKLTIDAYWKKWLIKTGKTTWIEFVKE